MSKYLRKFETEAAYSAATIYTPSVSLIASNMSVKFDPYIPPAPTFSGLTVYYNISDTSSPTNLFYAASGSGSGSGSGSSGVLPSAMIIDGTEVEVTKTYQFSTTGEHIVNYSFAENQVPKRFLWVTPIPSLATTVRKVENGDAITSIGEYAFDGCRNITAVTIGNSVTSIGEYAFDGCSSLTSIDIPSGVTSIGQQAFYGCSGLTSVTVDSNNAVFDSRNNCNAIIKTSNNTLVQGCKNTVIPDSVTSIGDFAFLGCNSLISITIPSGVTSIGANAFYECSSLTSVTVNATTPPTLSTEVFEITKNYPIYVPNVDVYKSASGWNTYASRLQPIV